MAVRSPARSPFRLLRPLAVACGLCAALASCETQGAELTGELKGLLPWRTAFADSIAYLAGRQDNTLHVIRIRGGEPRVAGTLAVPGRIDAVAVSGQYVLLGVNLFPGSTAVPLTREWLQRGWLRLDETFAPGGTFAGGSNLVVVDVSNPAEPRVASAISTTPAPMTYVREIAVDGPRAWLLTDRGAWAADLADPRAPKLQDRVSVRGTSLTAMGGWLYVVDGGLSVLNAATGRPVGQLSAEALGLSEDGQPQEATVSGVAVGARHAYLATTVSGGRLARHFVVAVDVGDPARPREVGRVEVDFADGLVLRDQTLWVYGSGGSRAVVKAFDVRNPAALRERSSVDLDELTDIRAAGNLEAQNGFLYVQNDSRGLSVFRLLD